MEQNVLAKIIHEPVLSLPAISDKSALQRGKGYNYDPYSGSFIFDWEVNVYPDGDNDWSWTDTGNNDNQGDWTDYGGGTGGTPPVDEVFQTGLEAINELESDLNNGEVLAVQHSSSVAAAFSLSSSLALTAKGMSMSIIQALKADAGIVRAMGNAVGIAGTSASLVSFVIGVSDGDISTSDMLNGAATLVGGASLAAGMLFAAPVLAGILGVSAAFIGVGAGIFSVVENGDSGNAPGYW